MTLQKELSRKICFNCGGQKLDLRTWGAKELIERTGEAIEIRKNDDSWDFPKEWISVRYKDIEFFRSYNNN